MRKPLELYLRHLEEGHYAPLEVLIAERAHKLERFVSDIIGCRVVVERPQRGHRSHNPVRVRIRVTVPPNTRLVVAHHPLDPNASPLDIVQAAFDAMERQLDEFAARRRNDMKEHTRARTVSRGGPSRLERARAPRPPPT